MSASPGNGAFPRLKAADLRVALAAAGHDVVLAPDGLTVTLRNTP